MLLYLYLFIFYLYCVWYVILLFVFIVFICKKNEKRNGKERKLINKCINEMIMKKKENILKIKS